MENRILLKSRKLYIDKEAAFQMIDCHKENPMYKEMEELYEQLWEEMQHKVRPKGFFKVVSGNELGLSMEDSKQREYGVVLYTLGEGITDYIRELFEQGEYLKGMLLDAMADSCLFAMEEEWKKDLIKICCQKKRGIERRMEPLCDFSPEVNRTAWELVEGKMLGVTVTSGSMFDPVKTCLYLFLLTEDVNKKEINHDCAKCRNEHCKLRKEW